MKCKHCGKEFKPEHGNQKYCSNECKSEAKNVLNHHYYELKKQETTHDLVECGYCHKLFRPQHGNQKYCNESCQYHASLEQTANYRVKSYHKHKKRGGDKFWGMGSGGLGAHRHEDEDLELLKIRNELKRLNLVK